MGLTTFVAHISDCVARGFTAVANNLRSPSPDAAAAHPQAHAGHSSHDFDVGRPFTIGDDDGDDAPPTDPFLRALRDGPKFELPSPHLPPPQWPGHADAPVDIDIDMQDPPDFPFGEPRRSSGLPEALAAPTPPALDLRRQFRSAAPSPRALPAPAAQPPPLLASATATAPRWSLGAAPSRPSHLSGTVAPQNRLILSEYFRHTPAPAAPRRATHVGASTDVAPPRRRSEFLRTFRHAPRSAASRRHRDLAHYRPRILQQKSLERWPLQPPMRAADAGVRHAPPIAPRSAPIRKDVRPQRVASLRQQKWNLLCKNLRATPPLCTPHGQLTAPSWPADWAADADADADPNANANRHAEARDEHVADVQRRRNSRHRPGELDLFSRLDEIKVLQQEISESNSRSQRRQAEVEYLLSDARRHVVWREGAQQNLERIERIKEPKLTDDVERPPSNAEHWDLFYWASDEHWDEGMDKQAIIERKKMITVEYNKGAFSPLTQTAVKRLRHTLSTVENYRLIQKLNGCEITGEDLRRLRPHCWLNDEIVNAYTYLLTVRNEEARKVANASGKSTTVALPKVRSMNSFFYSRLVETARGQTKYNYAGVRRWTRRFDSFGLDMLLFPINQGNVHWTLGVVNFRDKTVAHLDSMGTGGSAAIRDFLLRWVEDEAKDKGKSVSIAEWRGVSVQVPQQQNADDCGVFSCKFADFLCKGWSTFTFDQQHINYFRARMAHEILMGKAV